MKKELSTGAMAGIVGLAVVVIGGLGYMWYSKIVAEPPMDQAREKMEAAAAKARYDGFKNRGGESGGAPSGAPAGAGSSPEAAARAKMSGNGGAPPTGN